MEKIFVFLVIIGLSLVMESAYAQYGDRMKNENEGSSSMNAGQNYGNKTTGMSVKKATFDQKEDLIKKLESKKDKLSREIDKLKGENQTSATKAKIDEKENALRAIDDDVAKVRSATPDNWDQVRGSIRY